MKLKFAERFQFLGAPLVTGLLAFTGCVDEGADESVATQAVHTDTFTLTRIPIPYTPNFGSLSGLTYDPSDGTWWTHDDNRSGTVTYPTLFNFRVVNGAVEVIAEVPLRDENGNLVVASPSNSTQTVKSPDLDPEGIAMAPDGTFWMIDEENDTFFHVSREGQILSRHFAPGFRGGYSPTLEAGEPTRVRGAGFEGIAISPDGNTVYGGHQTALATFPEGEGDVTFIAALHIPTDTWRIYKVPLDPVASYDYPEGLNPAVRMGLHDLFFDSYDEQGRERLIWMERDNKRDDEARDKRIYRVTLPDYATYDGRVLTKELMVDLVANGYTLEKPEGLVRLGNRYYVVNDNVQTATDPMEFTIVEGSPEWNSSTVYLAGHRVMHNGSFWEASWWTQNQKPGDPWGPWQQLATAADGTTIWTASRIFVGGEEVIYEDGHRYRAKWWTRNQKPGDPWGPWQRLD
jgi:hypothetical protein